MFPDSNEDFSLPGELPEIKPLQTNVPSFIRLKKLAEDLLDPEVYGLAVSEEIRNQARKALGIK